MNSQHWVATRSGVITAWLAALVGGGGAVLAWYGYRAANEWLRNSERLEKKRTHRGHVDPTECLQGTQEAQKAQERLPLLCLLCFLFLSTERLAAPVNPNHRCEKTADRSDRVLYNPRRDSLLRPRRFDHSFTW